MWQIPQFPVSFVPFTEKILKDTLVQISKSANIFVFT